MSKIYIYITSVFCSFKDLKCVLANDAIDFFSDWERKCANLIWLFTRDRTTYSFTTCRVLQTKLYDFSKNKYWLFVAPCRLYLKDNNIHENACRSTNCVSTLIVFFFSEKKCMPSEPIGNIRCHVTSVSSHSVNNWREIIMVLPSGLYCWDFLTANYVAYCLTCKSERKQCHCTVNNDGGVTWWRRTAGKHNTYPVSKFDCVIEIVRIKLHQ